MLIAYCDDEPIQLELMETMTRQWAAKRNIPLRFLSFQSGEEVLFEASENGFPFDLLIIDIDMKGMNGMELARNIRKTDGSLPILFLTNRKEYVFEGYEVSALRYVLKPMNENKLEEILEELYAKQTKIRKYLIERINGEDKKIAVEDILYAEAAGHYVTLHTKQETFEWKKSFSEFVKQLEDTKESIFLSTHRSYLVNVAEIERVMRTECVLSDGSLVPVSRAMYQKVNEAFIRYYKEEISK